MPHRIARLAAGALALALTLGLPGLGPRSASAQAVAVADSTNPYQASDPALVAATGRPQLVEFYHRRCIGCRDMAPVVHELAEEYEGRIDFVYLDIQDPRTAAAKERLGFEATPHFFTLTPDGRVTESWQGVDEAKDVDARLRRLLDEASSAPD